jgi:hypothetical protein
VPTAADCAMLNSHESVSKRYGCSSSLPISSNHYRSRAVLSLAAGVAGVALAARTQWDCRLEEPFCVERTAIVSGGVLSICCCGAAVHQLYQGGALTRQWRNIAPILLISRALFCGACVALLGCAAAFGRPHLPLMAVMQVSTTIGAWEATLIQKHSRSKSQSHSLEDGQGAGTASPPSRGSRTLPRGWRYNSRLELFEHKRSGRVQSQPPSALDTGSPLHADLPPCDEERGVAPFGCAGGAGGGASDSGSEDYSSHRGRRRSRTWSNGVRAPPPSRRTPMNVWELRDALGSDGVRHMPSS